MSENGPREGTRDLPRPPREAGFRNMDEASAAGQTYRNLGRRARRRRDLIRELLQAGLRGEQLIAAFSRDHPLEPPITPGEIERAELAPLPPPSKVRARDAP